MPQPQTLADDATLGLSLQVPPKAVAPQVEVQNSPTSVVLGGGAFEKEFPLLGEAEKSATKGMKAVDTALENYKIADGAHGCAHARCDGLDSTRAGLPKLRSSC